MTAQTKQNQDNISMVSGAIRRSKDDLHEWSIYRQNLTSFIAAAFLKSANYESGKIDLPYGNFRMNGQAIKGVIRAAKAENTKLGQKAEIYLKFGLPRVTILELKPSDCKFLKEDSEVFRVLPAILAGIILSNLLQSERHHTDYFSDQHAISGFNYLRYAKADELRNEGRNVPIIAIKNLSVALDKRTFLDRCIFRIPPVSHFLHDISFTLKGGDTMAVLYTTESEMRVLLEVLSNSMAEKYLISGTIENNGCEMNVNEFGDRVAYVNTSDIYSWLTVAQTLRLGSSFVTPEIDANMIEQLIQTLALSPYRNFLCGKLDILLLDNVTKDMNLYDMAFITDYLRDWAIKLNRIVVMAAQPPTIEILTMFRKVLLIASGRVAYFGPSSHIMSYFEEIGFPCPPFKNPCDYYVDLLTHDYLTSESSWESRNRIKRLTDIWKERVVDVCEMQVTISELSPKVRHVSCHRVALLIYRRFFEMFLSRPWFYARELFYAFLISLFVGCIFYDIPDDRHAAITTRFGFIISILGVFLLPNLFIQIEKVFDERSYLIDDIRNRLYDPTFYVTVKILYDLPVGIVCNALYALPAYLLSGLPSRAMLYWPSALLFTIILSIHAFLWRYVTWIIAYGSSTQMSAIATTVVLLSSAIILSGFLIHPNSFPIFIKQLHYYNPTKCAGGLLAENEFLRRTVLSDWFFEIVTGSSIDYSNITELLIGCERRQILAKKIKNVKLFYNSVGEAERYRFTLLHTVREFEDRKLYTSQDYHLQR
uniref:ABC transporter domain-containing protein n=1 Tax=Setaria digitata TaxID=48799 RepID=A0A915Q5D4_9BILA